jgi:hypothetical protein
LNPYLKVLAAAEEDRQSHYQREADLTREHFARHPECRRIISAMDRDGQATRIKGEIDIEARCRPGWFKESMWKGTYYETARPLEAVIEGVEEQIWISAKQGHAIEVHKFMRWYLAGQPAAPVIARTQPSRRRGIDPSLIASAAIVLVI